jgi:hypothetical protein
MHEKVSLQRETERERDGERDGEKERDGEMEREREREKAIWREREREVDLTLKCLRGPLKMSLLKTFGVSSKICKLKLTPFCFLSLIKNP